MKSLDEQIEYMRREMISHVEAMEGFGLSVLPLTVGRYICQSKIDACQAILDTLLQVKGKSNVTPKNWNGCFHEWEEIESQFSNEKKTAVRCVKCKCPGERDDDSAAVFWPAT